MSSYKSRIRAALSALIVASFAAQASVTAFAGYTPAKAEPELKSLTSVIGETSEYGEQYVYYTDENGNEVNFNLVPDEPNIPNNGISLPSYYNLNNEGYVTSVKYQGSTNTCWAHAALSAAESSMVKQGLADISVDLSETHLVWFSEGLGAPEGDPLYGDQMDIGNECYSKGGNDNIAIGALASWMGAADESSYPVVTSRSTLDEQYRYDSKYHLQNAITFDASDRDSIKNYLMQNGAMTLAYYTIDNNYKTGDTYTSFYQNQSKKTNHAVTLVGWDDNFSASNFAVTPPGNGAWIIKNNWGTQWGSNGFFYISYYDTSVSQIWSYEMDKNTNYGSSYQNCMAAYPSYYFPNCSITGSNVFTAFGNEPISAVSFYTSEASTTYIINIYVGVDDKSNPMSGKKVLTQSGIAEYSGYHTVDLSDDINIPAGTKFSVNITLDKANTYFWVDSYATDSCTSYITYKPNADSSWYDVSADGHNVAIRAFTKSKALAKPKVTATPGNGSVLLTWEAVPTATDYYIYSYAGDGQYIFYGTTSETSFTVSGLTNGQTYQFLVRAFNAAEGSPYDLSDLVPATPFGGISKPAFTAEAGNASVKLSWEAVPTATDYYIYSYAGDGQYIFYGTTSETSFTVSGLTNGQTYQFLVRAFNAAEGSPYDLSDLVPATPQ